MGSFVPAKPPLGVQDKAVVGVQGGEQVFTAAGNQELLLGADDQVVLYLSDLKTPLHLGTSPRYHRK